MTFPEKDGRGAALNLEYEDPLMARISPDEIIRRGGRVRRRNRIMRACGTLVVAATAAVVASTLLMSPSKPATVSPFRLLAATSAYQMHLPAGTPVIVDQSASGWRSFVWVSVDEQFCSGTIGVSAQTRSATAITCVKPVSFGVSDKDSPAAIGPLTEPVFQTLPPPDSSGAGDSVLVIGLARNDVASVEIDFLGSHIAASVYPIYVGGTVKYVAYAARLPLNGASSYGTGDITALIARNKIGGVLTG